ncbi:hypothetical protein SELSPUOL_01469 [Selenomonas sputigena ATCC 35185]|uniref:Uncharacterized protein n=1 Tax=Selenomonas sputigena (strain ATCC 35185 / DSM 20758 / CCUG 44933 / VPI D19B-28) TaxID=546271 RepID=C9LVH5_SELS3|nr:hypothetical protein SELSPUOL_01469 [Selenomonas sputigena ATCC 35185]
MRPKTPASFLRRTKDVSSERIPFSAGENFQLSDIRNNKYLFIFIEKGVAKSF